MYRLALVFAILFPVSAQANCSSAVMQICLITPLESASEYKVPCSFTVCSTADQSFEFFRFADGSHVRLDYADLDAAGGRTARMSVELSFMTGPNERKVYQDRLVTLHDGGGEVATVVGMGDEGFMAAVPCGAPCAGIDPDDFGQ